MAAVDGTCVTFDMCMLGLRSPDGQYMRKTTTLKTNIPMVVSAFSGLRCLHKHKHVAIQGNQAGQQLSKLAAVYPPRFCEKIAKAIQEL